MSGAGRMVRLALEAPERAEDGAGGFRVTWQRLGWLWGEMAAGSARERGAQFGPVSVVRWRIAVRAAAVGDPRRPVAGQRFWLGERVFNIEAVAERDPAGRWLDCFATEETGA